MQSRESTGDKNRSVSAPSFFLRSVHGVLLTALCLLLSIGSGTLQAEIRIVQLANEGVMVTDGTTRIIIDGMVVENYSVYGGLEGEALQHFEQQTGPFGDIDLVLASHRHHDHNQPEFACRYLQKSQARVLSSPQVLGLMRERCREFVTTSPRVTEFLPEYGNPFVIEEEGARVSAFLLSHGTRKYARIQNYGHLIEIGGMTVLHIGDAAMDATDFERAGLGDRKIDVALIPFWYFQPGPGWEVVEAYMNAPMKIAVHIPPGEMAEVKEHLDRDYPQVIVLERPLAEARFIAAEPQPDSEQRILRHIIDQVEAQ